MEHNIDPIIWNKIGELYQDSKKGKFKIPSFSFKTLTSGIQPQDFKNHYLAISKEQGHFIHDLILEKDLKRIVEFGTSFGISTLFLAAAARKINGQVITTELVEQKAQKAQKNFDEAGVGTSIELRVGDAMKTLYTTWLDSLESVKYVKVAMDRF